MYTHTPATKTTHSTQKKTHRKLPCVHLEDVKASELLSKRDRRHIDGFERVLLRTRAHYFGGSSVWVVVALIMYSRRNANYTNRRSDYRYAKKYIRRWKMSETYSRGQPGKRNCRQ